MRITESQLRSVVRRIIRENKRQQALDEGFFDKVKDFFKGDTKKAMEKIPALMEDLKSTYMAFIKKKGVKGKVDITRDKNSADMDFFANGERIYNLVVDFNTEDKYVSIQNSQPQDGDEFGKTFGVTARKQFSQIFQTFYKAQQASKYDSKTTTLEAVKFFENLIKLIQGLK